MGRCVKAIGYFRLVALVFVAGILTSNTFYVSTAKGQESQPTPQSPTASAAPADPEQGKRLFQQNCSPCHGADAGGGDGPDLHGVPALLGDPTVQGIVRRGIPGTAMPGSSALTDSQAANIVAYLRTLDSTPTSGQVTGDPKKGEALYNSSGCSACHMIAGQGGSIGPELTRVGAMRGATNLKARLQDPGANLPQVVEGGAFGSKWTQLLMFRAVQMDGRVVEGMRVGEDSFTIVLKDAGGKYHGLWKPDLRSLEKESGKSFMPSFKDTLSAAQQDDLVAYLMTLKGAQ
jgi:putative heme-binding domain-containing protein